MHRARHDHASKVIANAKVLSCTKPQMTLRITIQVIDISVWKLPFITVGRPIGQDDMVAFAHMLTVKFHIPCQLSLEALRRRVVAQRLLDCRFHQIGILSQRILHIRHLRHVHRKYTHETRQGLNTGDHKHGGRQNDFALGKRIAINVCFCKLGNQIIRRFAPPHRHRVSQKARNLGKRLVHLRISTLGGLVRRNRQNNL